nr:hypothetical protein [uncultured Eisenbergiella sp.]
MGTSKGYIAPTTVPWSQAKRAVTGYINNGDSDSRANAASKFATAMNHDIASGSAFSQAVGNILSFSQSVSRGGLGNALREYGRDDLIGKSSEEVFQSLIHEFTNNGSTTEDYLAAEAISLALKELDIHDMEQINDVSPDVLLKEMIIEYTQLSFAFRYEEKISMKRTPAETDKLIKEMDKYISNKLHSELDLASLKSVDFNKMDSSEIVTQTLQDAYHVFELFYEEA